MLGRGRAAGLAGREVNAQHRCRPADVLRLLHKWSIRGLEAVRDRTILLAARAADPFGDDPEKCPGAASRLNQTQSGQVL
jgi:hypothetical protein